MKKNIGIIDRIIRLVIGIFCTYLGLHYNFAFFVVAVFAFFEAFSSWCALYEILGIDTCETGVEEKKSKK